MSCEYSTSLSLYNEVYFHFGKSKWEEILDRILDEAQPFPFSFFEDPRESREREKSVDASIIPICSILSTGKGFLYFLHGKIRSLSLESIHPRMTVSETS